MSEGKGTAGGAPIGLLGEWVSGWYVLGALAATAIAWLQRQTEAVATIATLVEDPGYFQTHPLLLDNLRAGYSTEVAQAHMAALGKKAIDFYADSYFGLYDIAFPLLLMVAALLFILYATRPAGRHALGISPIAQRVLLLVPIVLFALDMAENTMVSSMLSQFPTVNAKVVETASALTATKWFVAMVEGLLVIGLAAFTLHRLIEPAPEAQKR